MYGSTRLRKADPVLYSYSILGLRFLCELPYEIEILKEAAPFLHPLDRGAGTPAVDTCGYDFRICLRKAEQLPPVPGDAVFRQGRLYSRQGGDLVMHMLLTREKPPYACAIHRAGERRVDCLYLAGNERYLRYSRQLSDLIGMETVFLQFQSLMLHASFIRWNGQGILFTAPSGTGKSTQAELWERYEGAEIINGDRAGLRAVDGRWWSYGLPYAGSSGIYRNESAPVSAIIVLAQAKENRLSRVRPAQAVRRLYPETTIHRWDPVFTGQALELLLRLTSEVPIYLLECRPDRGAVELVKNELEKEAPLYGSDSR